MHILYIWSYYEKSGKVCKKIMRINVDSLEIECRPINRWKECVKNDMSENGVNVNPIWGSKKWKYVAYCSDPK